MCGNLNIQKNLSRAPVRVTKMGFSQYEFQIKVNLSLSLSLSLSFFFASVATEISQLRNIFPLTS